jgi:hypothetical protein
MLLSSLNQAQVDALAALRLQASWKTYCNMLADELTATQDRMVREADEPTLRWLRGRAQTLNELIGLTLDAQVHLERVPVHKRPEGTW